MHRFIAGAVKAITGTSAMPSRSRTAITQLTLKFAEIQFASPGSRTFNVTVNGAAVLTNLDIVAQGGALESHR
jgi:hypothetical protein